MQSKPMFGIRFARLFYSKLFTRDNWHSTLLIDAGISPKVTSLLTEHQTAYKKRDRTASNLTINNGDVSTPPTPQFFPKLNKDYEGTSPGTHPFRDMSAMS